MQTNSRFVYENTTKIYFGEGQLGALGVELAQYGSRVLLVYGGGSIKKTGLYSRVVAQVQDAGLTLFELSGVQPNPRVDLANEGAQMCRDQKIDAVLAVGGGSVLDTAKFIGLGAFYDGDVWDILTQRATPVNSLPVVTVLTLAATGSEMNAAGVLSKPGTNEKIGFMHSLMQPKVSFLDPANTYSVSAHQTACGAADMISHIFEFYFNMTQDLHMLDTVMEGLLKTILHYAPIAQQKPQDYDARANLMWASSWAISKLIFGGKRQAWSCHPIEHQLSAYYDIAHGLGLAVLTPRWMEYALNEHTAPKFYQFGTNVFGIDPALPPMEVAKKSIGMLSDFLFNTLGLESTLAAIGIDDSHFPAMAQAVCGDGVLPGFVPLRRKDVENILTMCL